MNAPFRPHASRWTEPSSSAVTRRPNAQIQAWKTSGSGRSASMSPSQSSSRPWARRASGPVSSPSGTPRSRGRRARGEGRYAVALERAEALRIVAGPVGEPLHDSRRPEARGPFEGKGMRMVIAGHRVVGGHHRAARRVVCAGQGFEGYEAEPVVFPGPSRTGDGPRPGPVRSRPGPNRDPAGGEEPDVAVDIGIGDALRGGVEVPQVGDEALPVPRFRKAEAGLQGEVVVAEGGPRQGEHVAGRRRAGRRRGPIVENRAVAALPDVHHHVVAVPHLDHLAPYIEPAVAIRSQVARGVLRIELLEEEVLGVRAGVREAPRGPAVVPEHHDRHAGEGRPDEVASGPREVGEVPHRGHGEAEVGVVREERLARGAPLAVHYPAIGAGMAAPGPEQETRRHGSRLPARGRRGRR